VTLFLALCMTFIVVIAGLALALPCKGCELRRERLKQTYEAWKKARARE